MGRMTATPEIKNVNGKNVVSFSIAVDRNYKVNNAYPTDFIEIVAWRNTADFIAKYFHKGDMIVVSGSLQTRSWKDKNGNSRTAYEVIADEVSFCGTGKKNNVNNNRNTTDDDDGEMPY